ncbi:MAG TPA: SRPBCC family protein [Mycobacteriales bacterium]|jgi:uncharacterized protein YndB with AHSA1/START domain|nr:SRPBCC family protein [Mycobacteriales bacterium]
MTSVSHSRVIAAPPEAVWAVLADFAAIWTWAPNVDHSAPASAARDGRGAVRRVQVGRYALLETVVEWQPSRQLSYVITGLPPVAGPISTDWQLAPHDDGTTVTVTTTVQSPQRPPGRIIGRALSRRLGSAGNQMLGGLAQHVIQLQEHR